MTAEVLGEIRASPRLSPESLPFPIVADMMTKRARSGMTARFCMQMISSE